MVSLPKAVVTGTTGIIGRALVSLLAHDGWDVHALVNPHSHRARDLLGIKHVSLHAVDISCYPSIAVSEIGRCDMFFHLAWIGAAGPGRFDAELQAKNIGYALDAVGLANQLGCETFVGAGSQAEFGRKEGLVDPESQCEPENAYGIAKLCAGSLSRIACEKAGMRHIWARIFSVYGPHDGDQTLVSSVIRGLLSGNSPELTKCEQMWDYLYCDDAARALALLAEKGRDGSVYCIGSGQARMLSEYVEEIRRQVGAGVPVKYGAIPYSSRQVMNLQADISSLSRDTGFEPHVGFADGISRTIAWWRGSYDR